MSSVVIMWDGCVQALDYMELFIRLGLVNRRTYYSTERVCDPEKIPQYVLFIFFFLIHFLPINQVSI